MQVYVYSGIGCFVQRYHAGCSNNGIIANNYPGEYSSTDDNPCVLSDMDRLTGYDLTLTQDVGVGNELHIRGHHCAVFNIHFSGQLIREPDITSTFLQILDM